MNTQLKIRLPQAAPQRAFDGSTYSAARDHVRLVGQLACVWAMLQDGGWHTLRDLATAASASEASVSARLRDLRKARYGAHVIERQHLHKGLWQYRWVKP